MSLNSAAKERGGSSGALWRSTYSGRFLRLDRDSALAWTPGVLKHWHVVILDSTVDITPGTQRNMTVVSDTEYDQRLCPVRSE